MKKLALIALVAALAIPASAFAAEDVNPSGPVYEAHTVYSGYEAYFGDIAVVANKAGATFTWTQQQDLGGIFFAGHTYKEIAKITVDDPSSWCGPNNYAVGYEPYMGGVPQTDMYWKQIDQTTGLAVPCH